jgi:hypothetical protein
MTDRMDDLPTPAELIEARKIIRRLHYATFDLPIRDMGGMKMWDSLVEGGRAIAVTTAYLGSYVNEEYGKAWEEMMNGDD